MVKTEIRNTQNSMTRTLINELAIRIDAYKRCITLGNTEWEAKHKEVIDELVDRLPSGSGINNGTRIDMDASSADKIVFNVDYHHMNDGGYYDGWTSHVLTVTPSFIHGIHLRISGIDKNGVKEYLADIYRSALTEEIDTVEVCKSVGQI